MFMGISTTISLMGSLTIDRCIDGEFVEVSGIGPVFSEAWDRASCIQTKERLYFNLIISFK